MSFENWNRLLQRAAEMKKAEQEANKKNKKNRKKRGSTAKGEGVADEK